MCHVDNYKVKVFQMSNNGTYKRCGDTKPRASNIYFWR